MTLRPALLVAPLAALLVAITSCMPTVVPEPGGRRAPPPPPPPPPPRATQPIVQQQPGPDIQDWAVTPGSWSYSRDARAATARFGAPGAAPAAWLRCDLSTRAITVGRSAVAQASGGASAMMAVLTSFGRSEWPANGVAGGLEARRGASDPGLDAIAFSRGRFALMLGGQPAIVIPTWAEPVRVIEDCRS